MKTAYAGIASVAALAAIPEPVPGKNFAMGVGYGNFQGSDAMAVDIKARMPNKNISLTAGAGFSDDKWTTSAGFGVSF